MSVSVDTQSLESLKQFKAFFDFLSDPKKYKELLDQTSEVLKKLETSIGVYDSLQKVEEYSKQVNLRALQAQQDIDKGYDLLEGAEKAQQEKNAFREKQINEKEQTLVDLGKKLLDWEKELSNKDSFLKQKEMSLNKTSSDLNGKAEELKALDKKLQDKERAFKALSN